MGGYGHLWVATDNIYGGLNAVLMGGYGHPIFDLFSERTIYRLAFVKV
jgi:hypothetical protein